ncbi:conserved hypothetical protein [Haloferula helveola]|uniref:VWFA domain-containing protein n=1 Tax=Haloferula helveola TaxID=490095 RepID=A0ABN6HA11_9BACT|nr:conserved hypothetical protein [Haloferula helveola]
MKRLPLTLFVALCPWILNASETPKVQATALHLNHSSIEGSVELSEPNDAHLNGDSSISETLAMPGSPRVVVGDDALIEEQRTGSGTAQPDKHKVTLNSTSAIGTLLTRIVPSETPVATPPASAEGKGSLVLKRPEDVPNSFSEVSRIGLHARYGPLILPTGVYDRIDLAPESVLQLGEAGSAEPQLYQIGALSTSKGCRIEVLGPIELRLKHSLTLHGTLGSTDHPEWFLVTISDGSLILSPKSTLHGAAVVPSGNTTLNGGSLLKGTVSTGRLTLNDSSRIIAASTEANLPPVAIDSEIETNRDEPVGITLNATDPESRPLTFFLLEPPSHGALSALSEGQIQNGLTTYTPEPGFAGEDSFRFKVSDGVHESESATVRLTVRQTNRPPIASDITIEINQGTAESPILLTAVDPDDDELTFTVVTPPAHGTLSGTPPALSYTHTGDRTTTPYLDSLTYIATDPDGYESPIATVQISLLPVNRPPAVAPYAESGREDQPHAIDLAASDPDGDSLTFDLLLSDELPGKLVHPDGSPFGTFAEQPVISDGPDFVFVPDLDFHGTVEFSVTVSDGALASESTVVAIEITPVNDPPSALPLTIETPEDTSVEVPLAAIDVDGDALSFTITSDPTHGTLTGTPPNLTYLPAPDYSGPDRFTFAASDGQLPSLETAVDLVVLPINDPPSTADQIIGTEEDTPAAVALSAADPDGDALQFRILAPPLHGTLSGDPPELTYTPELDYHGPDIFTWQASDGTTDSDVATVSIEVTPVNDPPRVSAKRVSATDGEAKMIALDAADPDGEELELTIFREPELGTVEIDGDGVIYRSDDGASGVDRFSVVATDGTLESLPAEIVVVIASRPRITILSPADGAEFGSGDEIPIRVAATDVDGEIAVIVAEIDGSPVATGSGSPLEAALSELEAGTHSLVIKAVDDSGLERISNPIQFTVIAENTGPVVSAGSDRVVTSGAPGPNLILNPGNESALVDGAIAGWTQAGDGQWGQGSAVSRLLPSSTAPAYPDAPEGNAFFHVISNLDGELWQDVDLSESRSDIKEGSARIHFEALVRSYQRTTYLDRTYTGRDSDWFPTGELDEPSVILEFWNDDTGSLLQTLPIQRLPAHDHWQQLSGSAIVPPDTTRVRVRLLATRLDLSTADPQEKNDAMFDAVSLRLSSPGSDFLHGTVVDDGLPEPRSLTINWRQLAGPVAAIEDSSAAATPVRLVEPGPYRFELTASDGTLSASDTVEVELLAGSGNEMPRVDCGPDIATEFSSLPLALSPTVTDDSPDFQIEWRQLSGPGKASFTDPRSVATAISFPGPGSYLFELGAFDEEWTATDQIAIEVSAPQVRAPLDLVIVTDHSPSMWGLKAETDPSTPIYKARFAAARLIDSLDPATDRVAIRRFHAGFHDLTADFAAARDQITQQRGELGTFGTFQPSNIDLGIQGALDHLDSHPRSEPADRAIVVFNDGAGPYADGAARAARDSGVRVIVVSFANGIDPIDTENMRIQASVPADFLAAESIDDTTALFATLQRTLLLGVNRPPIVNAGPPIWLPRATDTTILRGSYTDDSYPAGTSPSILWEVVSGPPGVSISNPNSLTPRMAFESDGEYRLRLSVDDGAAVATDHVTIRVAQPCDFPAPTGLTAWWPFDGNLRDAGGSLDLTRYGYWESPTFTEAVTGQAVSLDDVGDVLAANETGELGFNSDAGFSIECRIRPRSNAPSYLFGLVNPDTGSPVKSLTWGHPNLNANGLIHFGSNLRLNTTVLPLDAWHHVVMTHNRLTHETWAYINGEGKRISTSPIAADFPVDHQLVVGGLIPTYTGLNTIVTADPARRFDGEIDDLAFYSRVLESSEVIALRDEPGGKCPPLHNSPPVVDAGAAISISDVSGAGRLEGFATDDAGQPLVEWVQVAGPGTAVFSDRQSLRPAVSFDQPGIYTLQLNASDGFTSVADTTQVHLGFPNSATAPDGLVAWMPGNQHPNDLVQDRAGIWSGNEAYSPVKVADGFQFGGSVSWVRFLPPINAPPLSQEGYTIETWMEIPEASDGLYSSPILSFQNTAGARVQRLDLTRAYRSTGWTPALAWTLSNNTGTGALATTLVGIPLNRPFHLALVFDPTTSSLRQYIDGSLNFTQGVSGSYHHHFDSEFYIGGYPGDARVFPGKIDELSFYDRALTPTEVAEVFTAVEAGKDPSPAATDSRLNAGSDLTLYRGDSHGFSPTLDPSAFPSGNPDYRWKLLSGPEEVFFSDAASSDTIATFGTPGRYTLGLTVSDGSLTLSDTVRVDVIEPVIEAPVVTIPDSLSIQLPESRIEIQPDVTDDGLPSGNLSARWLQLSGPAPVGLISLGTFGVSVNFQHPGDYALVFEVADGLHTVTREVAIQVLPAPLPNQAPEVEAGADLVEADATFWLNGSATDDGKPGTTPIAYQWRQISGPSPASLLTPLSVSTSASVTAPGTYRFQLVASDGELYALDEVTVTVPGDAPGLPNLPPTVSLPRTATAQLPAATLSFNPVISDDDRTDSPLSYSWTTVDGPAPAAFSTADQASTGVTFPAAGLYRIGFRVSDGEFAANAIVTVDVLPPGNTAPLISMGPGGTVRPYDSASLTATAVDDGLPAGELSYLWRQVSGPELADISDPASADSPVILGAGGAYVFELAVSDGDRTVRDTVTWYALGAPSTRIVFPTPGSEVTDRSLIDLQARASIEGGRITSLHFEKEGSSIGNATRLSSSNDWILRLPPLPAGFHTITAVAHSADGQTAASAPVTFEIVDFDEQALTLEIESPSDGDTVTGHVEIRGTAYSSRLESWRLELAPIVPSGAIAPREMIASGSAPVVDALLGTLDPSLSLNGAYQLILSGTTTAGSFSEYSVPILIDGNLKIGHFALDFEDLSIPMSGLPLTVTRTYDSRSPQLGDFGPAWGVGLRSIRIRKAGLLGEGWEQDQVISGILPIYAVNTTTRKRVIVTFPDGRTETFEPFFRASNPASTTQLNVQKFVEISEGTLEFRPVGNSVGTLEIDGASDVIWNGPIPGRGTVIDLSFQPADPTRFRYTDRDGTSYVIDESSGLLELSEPNGNTLTINPGGLSHSNGEHILFTRDPLGRIREITDPAGNAIRYGYDDDGMLSSVTDRTGNTTTFLYENPRFPHYLTTVIDPRGIHAIRSEYDADGRLIAQTDGAGNRTEFEHHLDDNREVIRDRLGHTTVHEYDERGNVVRTTNALGQTTHYTYDSRDNEISVTTPLGHTTTRSYDASDNLISETDPLGNTQRFSYDEAGRPTTFADGLGQGSSLSYGVGGNVTSMTDAGGATVQFETDASGNLGGIVDAFGTTTRHTHDARGNRLSTTNRDSEGNLLRSAESTYNANGNRVSETIHTGSQSFTTRFEFDESDRATRTIHPDNSSIEIVYNSIGKIAKRIDAGGRETVMTYDSRGHLARTDLPDGSSTTSAFDVEGRKTAETNAAGVTTYTLYDPLDRVTTVILPDDTMPPTVLSEIADIASAAELQDNPRITTDYDADGRVIATTDPRGNTTRFEYDAAGRRTATIDPLGNRFEATYDAANRQVSSTDALGRTTRYEYDASGRLTGTIFPDGTSSLTTYDALGRRTASIDQEGNTTTYEYGALNHLVAATDAEGGRTEYDYDARGLQRIQRDALGRETYYDYDALGRRTGRTLPLGQRESLEYDPLGRLVRHTDFNGYTTAYEYDPLNDRLIATRADPSHPSLALPHAPAGFEFEHDTLGRPTAATIRNAAGAVLHTDHWSYDSRSRTISHASTNGTLFYAWDAADNLSAVQSDTPDGYDLSYAYDAANRMSDVWHGQEGIDPTAQHGATYSYTPNGNLAGVGYANQVTHAYAYDLLNRLTGVEVERQPLGSGGSATPLQGFAYTLNRTGHRTRIDETGAATVNPASNGDTRTVHHLYDRLNRLTTETITPATAEPVQLGIIGGSVTYSYDSVGNRKTRTVANAGGLGASRTLSEVLPNQTHLYDGNDRLTHHSYDSNGNTTSSPADDYASIEDGVPPGSALEDVYSFTNRLIRRTRADGVVIDLTYNANGDRVGKWVERNGINEGSHRYLIDRLNPTGYSQIAEERNDTGELVTVYDIGLDVLAFHTNPASNPQSAELERQWITYDGLGSVRALTNDAGEITESYTYEAYGQLIGLLRLDGTSGLFVAADPSSTPHSPLLFTGEQWDADLGMYFLRARYLNPATGRLHTQDTYEGRNGEPLSLHKYAYAHGNPVSNTDPSGNITLTEQAAVLGRITGQAGLGLSLVNLSLAGLGAPEWITVRVDGLSRMLFGASAMFTAVAISPAHPIAATALFTWGLDEMYAGWVQLVTGVRQRSNFAHLLAALGVPYPDVVAGAAPAIALLPKLLAVGTRLLTRSIQKLISAQSAKLTQRIANDTIYWSGPEGLRTAMQRAAETGRKLVKLSPKAKAELEAGDPRRAIAESRASARSAEGDVEAYVDGHIRDGFAAELEELLSRMTDGKVDLIEIVF